jgi:hypothetical protein
MPCKPTSSTLRCREQDPSQNSKYPLLPSLQINISSDIPTPASTMGALSRFAVAVAALYVPLATADTPASLPRITSVQYSGNGCSNDAARSGGFNDPTFSYNRFAAALPGRNQTVNCEIHVQAAGASSGWQVALSDVDVKGHLVLDAGTRLDYYTTVYYSQNAPATVCSHFPVKLILLEANQHITVNHSSAHHQQRQWHSRLPSHPPPGHQKPSVV